MSFAKNTHPMFVFDRHTLAVLDINDAAVRRYGFSRQSFLTMTLLDIRPTSEIPKLLQLTHEPRWKMTGITAEKWHHQTKNGTVFPVTITSWELTFRGHSAILALARESASD